MAINELDRALGREDAEALIRQVDAYSNYVASGADEWPAGSGDDFGAVLDCFYHDVEKALAYVVIAAARSDDVRFLGFVGATLLEDLVDDPSPELLDRIVAEGHRSERFKWLLDCPYEAAFSPSAWEALRAFRKRSGDVSPYETLPPRD